MNAEGMRRLNKLPKRCQKNLADTDGGDLKLNINAVTSLSERT